MGLYRVGHPKLVELRSNHHEPRFKVEVTYETREEAEAARAMLTPKYVVDVDRLVKRLEERREELIAQNEWHRNPQRVRVTPGEWKALAERFSIAFWSFDGKARFLGFEIVRPR